MRTSSLLPIAVLLVACRGQATRAPTPITSLAPEPAPATAPPEPAPTSVAPTPAPDPLASQPLPPGKCDPFKDLEDRRAGSLTVPARPPADPSDDGRMRSHVDGSLTAGSPRFWTGPPVPAFVPLAEGTAELFLLDHQDGTFVATYRDPYDASSCTLQSGDGARNCDFFVKAFDDCGAQLWALKLNDFMSRRDHLELQDIRHEAGVLYFNEACQSYSREAGGKCSALVAIDPRLGKPLWRTKNLVSNGRSSCTWTTSSPSTASPAARSRTCT